MKMQVGTPLALVAALTLIGVPPAAPADAQEAPARARRAWLGFAYADVDGTVVVRRVVRGSPAERAGLKIGDLVIQIGDREATPEALADLGPTLEPGDTVRLHVRWDGSERTVAVVAAPQPAIFVRARPAGEVITIGLDTLENTIRAYLDSARITLERVRVPRIRIERADSVVALHLGSERIILMADSLRRRHALRAVARDSIVRALRLSRRRLADSALRALRLRMDSVRTRDAGWRAENARRRAVLERMMAAMDDDAGAPLILRRTVGLGRRAVAGAEFSELNPGLARYFRTDDGLLVLRVLAGTPAANAGLEAGDVVVSVAGRQVRSIDDLRFAVAARSEAEPVELEIVRQGERRTLQLEHEEE